MKKNKWPEKIEKSIYCYNGEFSYTKGNFSYEKLGLEDGLFECVEIVENKFCSVDDLKIKGRQMEMNKSINDYEKECKNRICKL